MYKLKNFVFKERNFYTVGTTGIQAFGESSLNGTFDELGKRMNVKRNELCKQ
jgi:hypothetical protein